MNEATHQQVAMPEEYLESRTADPATWMRTPENLKRLAAFPREAEACRRAIAERKPEQLADVIGPVGQQHHTSQPRQNRGGRDC